MIRQLNQHYRVSFVLCTATQPALNSRRSFDFHFNGLDNVHEIMGDEAAIRTLHEQLRRVTVTLYHLPLNFVVL